MDAPWQIELLGWLRAVQGDRVVSRFQTHKTGALLAYLAFHLPRSHPRELLIEHLWPECDPEAGRNRLRKALTSLRHQLEPPDTPPGAVIVADRATVQLNPAACTTDVARFEAALQSAARAKSETAHEQWLARAIEEYRGELLPGYFEEWILPERLRLHEAFLQALGQLATLRERAGDLQGALQYANRTVSADPLREESHQELIRLLALSGQPAAARRQYQELEQMLGRELGIAPAPSIPRPARSPGERERTTGEQRRARREPVTLAGSRPSFAPPMSPSALPTGTVTVLLTEIIADRAWEQAGELTLGELEAVQAWLSSLFRGHGGRELERVGSRMVVLFGRASDALAAAVTGQQAVASVMGRGRQERGNASGETERADESSFPSSPHLRVAPSLPRMALHTGEIEPGEEIRRGPVITHAGWLMRAAHPGQILLSEKGAAMLPGEGKTDLRLVDLGLYRLRDAEPAERLFQVCYPGMTPDRFPPPDAPPGPVAHLPLRFTRFFGREPEMARLRELLGSPPAALETQRAPRRSEGKPEPLDPDVIPLRDLCVSSAAGGASSRLVTLTGPGGSGKTRLALEAVEPLQAPFQGAVYFVPLADVTDARLIPTRIADSLRLPRSPHREPLEQVIDFLSRQPALLLLDNFEHLVAAGAPLIRTLLEGVETLVVLVTSRRRLDLEGERELPVAPLPVPDEAGTHEVGDGRRVWAGTGAAGDGSDNGGLARPYTPHLTPYTLLQLPSVALFVDRAQAARPDFQLTAGNRAAVAEICRRLEGLPLALELAAGRAGVLTPQQMLARLERRFELLVSRKRDASGHHHSLWAALDWSYELLSPELQRFFARLSVFRGGFTLEAAEAVCGSKIQNTLDALEQLRECSLALVEEGGAEVRYRLLETLREYGAEQLAPQERAEVAARHAAYFSGLGRQAQQGPAGSLKRSWLPRLEIEHDNLRAALDWHGESGQVQAGLELGAALRRFWARQGCLAEGRGRLEALLQLPGAEARTAVRAEALFAAGVLADAQGDLQSARRLMEESLGIWRELGDRRGIAAALKELSMALATQGDQSWRRLAEESLAIWRELGERQEVAMLLTNLGSEAGAHGDYDAARASLEESLRICRELGDNGARAFPLETLGWIAGRQGDYETARSLLEESVRIWRASGYRRWIARALSHLGVVARGQGRLDEAQALLQESLEIGRELGDWASMAQALGQLGQLARDRGDLPEASLLLQQALTLHREQQNRRDSADCLEGLAAVACAQRVPERAARLLGAARALRDAIGLAIAPSEQPHYVALLADVCRALGDAAFTAMWEAGRALTWEQATAAALGDGAESIREAAAASLRALGWRNG
jgi:non-specific serine/threonine protein kinase